MSVYIEYVIIDNFVLTYTISLISYRVLGVRASRLRGSISAGLGTVVSVLYPFFSLGVLPLLGIKILLLVVLSFILFYKKSKLPISLAVFLCITFLFGGILFAIGYAVYGSMVAALTLPVFDFPIGVIILVILLLYHLSKRFISSLHKRRELGRNVYKVELEVMGKRIVAEGFCDSGNRIYDRKTGLPVAVTSFKLTQQILSDHQLIKILSGEGERSYKGARFLECKPFASKPQKLWLVLPEKFLLYFDEDKNIHIEVMLGLSLNAFNESEYGLIFGSAVLP